jgi:hypothetical protein
MKVSIRAKKKMTRSKQPSGQMTLEQKSSVATLSHKSNPKQNRWEGEPFYRPKSPNTPEIKKKCLTFKKRAAGTRKSSSLSGLGYQYCKRSKKKKNFIQWSTSIVSALKRLRQD